MTIAELFIKLGFKIEGQDSFNKAAGQLGFAEAKAINLKHAIAGLGTAFAGLMYFTASMGTNLYKFGLATGLSTRMLQSWQYAGARAGVTAGEIADSIKSIQDAQVQIQMGQGNLAPWALLGIDPRTDPMKVLWQLHERVKQSAGLSAAMGRYLASQLGQGENMFQFLRRDNIELGELQEKFKITQDEAKAADELNGKWAQMKQELESLAVQFGTTFGPKLVSIMNNLMAKDGPIDHLADKLQKLSAETPDGQKERNKLVHWAEGFAILAGVLGAGSLAAKAIQTGAALKILFGGGARAIAGGGGAAADAAAGTGGSGAASVTAGPLAGTGGLVSALAWPTLIAGSLLVATQWNKRRKEGHPINPLALAEGDVSRLGAGISAKTSQPHWLRDSIEPPWFQRLMANLHREPQGPAESAFGFLGRFFDLKPTDFRGQGFNGVNQGGDFNLTIHQTINGGANAAETGKESAGAIKKVINQSFSDYVNQNAIGSTAH